MIISMTVRLKSRFRHTRDLEQERVKISNHAAQWKHPNDILALLRNCGKKVIIRLT